MSVGDIAASVGDGGRAPFNVAAASGTTLLKGRKKRNWWPFLPTIPATLGLDRRVLGRRLLPNGTLDDVGRRVPSHKSSEGNTAQPRHKRRTPKHLKGKGYPGQWLPR